MANPRVGDLVLCVSGEYRRELGLGLDVGLYLRDRKRDGLVLFAALGRSAWIPTRALEVIAPDDPRAAPPPPWLLRVHAVMRLVDASDIELETTDAGKTFARIGCAGVDIAKLARLQELLGEAGPALQIVPGSMSRILVVFPTDQGPIQSPATSVS